MARAKLDALIIVPTSAEQCITMENQLVPTLFDVSGTRSKAVHLRQESSVLGLILWVPAPMCDCLTATESTAPTVARDTLKHPLLYVCRQHAVT